GRRHERVDAGDLTERPGDPRGPRRVVGRARLRGARARAGPDRRARAARRRRLRVARGARRGTPRVTEIVFFVFAALSIVGAVGVVASRNPVHSALWLVLTLVSVAVFFLQENAALLAAVQIIVYASAIVVLFLFVIMLLGVDREEALEDPIKYQRPAAF